jgi:hypothetical protein
VRCSRFAQSVTLSLSKGCLSLRQATVSRKGQPFERLRVTGALALIAISTTPVTAQTSITSPGPEVVSVTIYRDPNRSEGGEINLRYLSGFALITETRTVTVPAGQADIRFEGVAGGIIPVSAIVTGLPGGVVQKNRDARLLSPAALVDGSYGKIVHLKRTNRKTGKISEENAEIVSGPAGGVILKTRNGIEALGCAGLPESLKYDDVPAGLTAKPTLSVTTRSPRAATATVQLSYLASGFDWAANYVARVNPGGKTLDLFAWLTLANSNGESFVHANTQAVAGSVNRDSAAKTLEQSPPQQQLTLQCWPQDITSTHPGWSIERLEAELLGRGDAMFVGVQSAPMPVSALDSELIVTARKAMVAKQEELGDLKLYRIPEPVTVAANAQKQVALLEKTGVPFDHLYSVRPYARGQSSGPQPTQILVRMRNTIKKGLGIPLPSGTTAFFEPVQGQPMLLGQAPLRDSAVGAEVELTIGSSAQVEWMQTAKPTGTEIMLTNANPAPAMVEVRLQTNEEGEILSPSVKLGRKDGRPLWAVTVPANGTAKLTYRLKQN